jgi:hypothetical protein
MYARDGIVEAHLSAPYDDTPGWRIMIATEVNAEHSDLAQVSGQSPVTQTRRRPGSVNLVEHIDFSGGENRPHPQNY